MTKYFESSENGDVVCVEFRNDNDGGGYYVTTYLYEIFPLALIQKGYKLNGKLPHTFNRLSIDYETYCKIYNLSPVYKKQQVQLTPMETFQMMVKKREDLLEFKYYRHFKTFLDSVKGLDEGKKEKFLAHILYVVNSISGGLVELHCLEHESTEFLDAIESAFESEEKVLAKNITER